MFDLIIVFNSHNLNIGGATFYDQSLGRKCDCIKEVRCWLNKGPRFISLNNKMINLDRVDYIEITESK